MVTRPPQRLRHRARMARSGRTARSRERNPGGAAAGCLSVGVTGLTPEERFERHRLGTQSGRFVRAHGLRLRLDLVDGFGGCGPGLLPAWNRHSPRGYGHRGSRCGKTDGLTTSSRGCMLRLFAHSIAASHADRRAARTLVDQWHPAGPCTRARVHRHQHRERLSVVVRESSATSSGSI